VTDAIDMQLRRSLEQVSIPERDLAQNLHKAFERFVPIQMRGRVNRAVGTLVNASGVQAHLGEICELRTPGEKPMLAEVVGFSKQTAILTPLGSAAGISALTEVVPSGRSHTFAVGRALLGRVVNGLGEAIDGKGAIEVEEWAAVYRDPPNPLERQRISEPLPTGIRAIDTMLTMGEGQRAGIFAPPGIGKSTLLGMIARGAQSDVNVIALVGERGREVREFIEHNLPGPAMAKSVVVVATSDRPAMERVKAAYVATAIAEYFRDQGRRVLLLFDSLTRFARAQREVGLASGEPPTRRSYPPSIFSMLPHLLERAGQSGRGSITAFYSVLVEGEEENDPIAEEVRAILDGHIVLSRKLAMANHYPAIDVLASLSRVMSQVVPEAQRTAANRIRSLLAKHQEIELLLQIGEYKQGTDSLADAAVRLRPAIMSFLSQRLEDSQAYADSVAKLIGLISGHEANAVHPA
jgi:ATP synthase in type III secretion protein N